MTFVAKGYSSSDLAAAPATTSSAGDPEGATTCPTLAEPDVTIVTRVKGPEPGKD